MKLRQTHTYALLEVSAEAYAEIRAKLLAAGYEHAVHKDDDGERLDMHGIAVCLGEQPETATPALTPEQFARPVCDEYPTCTHCGVGLAAGTRRLPDAAALPPLTPEQERELREWCAVTMQMREHGFRTPKDGVAAALVLRLLDAAERRGGG